MWPASCIGMIVPVQCSLGNYALVWGLEAEAPLVMLVLGSLGIAMICGPDPTRKERKR